METSHKYAKQGTFLYSGGRQGTLSSSEYQKLILSQLFHNEFSRIADREEKSVLRSSDVKASRKRRSTLEEDEHYAERLKKKSVGVS
jgi:ribosomal 30S subunit maturation factor RimM